jgi:hypothetical protein
MIPPFTPEGLLPPGVHRATWDEVVARFGINGHRQRLLRGMKIALDELKLAGCTRAYVDGSFVTAKEKPRDYDLCYETRGVDPMLLHPVFFYLQGKRAAQKAKYFGELFPAHMQAAVGYSFFQFFQQDSDTGASKGIVAIDLRGLP